LPIFCEKIGVFLKKQCYDQIFLKFALFCVKNANFFVEFFGKNIFKNHNIGLCGYIFGNFLRTHPVTLISGETNKRGRRADASVHQRVVRRERSQCGESRP
jgi:hypothetical protein